MADVNVIETFLNTVDKTFPISLSSKQDLCQYAQKLSDKATLCMQYEGEEVISMVAGYTDNLVDNIAYVSMVATAPKGRGKGLATKLVKEFISICKNKNIKGVHLYTDKTNVAAIAMYNKIGFVPYSVKDDPRPDDVHLIYYI